MPEFKNRENERIALPDGRIIFLSRSVAVVGCVLCVQNDETYVLMVERGSKVDNSGKWCMPCGYLDWDETLDAAVKREIWEETGLDIDEFLSKHKVIYSHIENPYYVSSSPKSNRQNVSHHFGIVIKGPLPSLNSSIALESGEATSIQWVRLSAIPTKDGLESSGLKDHFAFDHNEDIHRFVDVYKRAGY